MSIVRDALKRVEERKRLPVDPHLEKALLVSKRSRRTQTLAFWVALSVMLLVAGGLAIWVLPSNVQGPMSRVHSQIPDVKSAPARLPTESLPGGRQGGNQGAAGGGETGTSDDWSMTRLSERMQEGIRFYREENYPRAEEAFRAALARDSTSAEAQNNLGMALRAQGRLPEAVAAYREAVRLRPEYPEAHHNLGIALSALGQKDEALRSFREAIRLRDGFAHAHLHLALALEQRGEVEGAAWHFRRYLSMAPADEREVAEKVRMRLKER